MLYGKISINNGVVENSYSTDMWMNATHSLEQLLIKTLNFRENTTDMEIAGYEFFDPIYIGYIWAKDHT